MRQIYKSIAIAIASMSLLVGPAYAALTSDQSSALTLAIQSSDAAGVQAIINAATTANDSSALAAIAAALTIPPAGQSTVNTSFLATVAAANGGNTNFVGLLGAMMATNLTPATVTIVLKAVLTSNPTAANALGPVIVADGNANMQTAVLNSGAATGGPGGTGSTGTGFSGGTSSSSGGGSERSGQVNGST